MAKNVEAVMTANDHLEEKPTQLLKEGKCYLIDGTQPQNAQTDEGSMVNIASIQTEKECTDSLF